jgi:MHS family proline/betaine transporter-like MFS transporter
MVVRVTLLAAIVMSPHPKTPARWTTGVVILGNIFEWYDFIVYGFFATSIAETFFPAEDERAALLATFAAFGVGYVLRPLGAIVLGLVGDWKGRKTALLLSVALMALGTTMTGVLPSYQALGILAPCLLVVARLIQGFAVGGNWGSSATYLVETAPEKRRGLYGSFQQVTAVAGVVLGSGMHSVLSAALSAPALQTWGWRIPFLAGILLAPISYYMGRSIPETPIYLHKAESGRPNQPNVLIAKTVQAFGLSIAWVAISYMFLIYMPTLTEKYFGFDAVVASWSNTIGLLMMLGAIPICGLVSDYVGRKPQLLVGCLIFFVLPVPIYSLIIARHSIELMVVAQLFFAVAVALFSGPGPAASVEIFDSSRRVSGVSIANSFASTIFGGFTPFIATWLILETSSPIAPFYYVMFTCLVSGIIIFKLPETARKDLG